MSVSKRVADEVSQPKRKRAYAGAVGGSSYRATTGAQLWGDVDPAHIQSTIWHLSTAGAGVLFGVTRDGTSAAVTLFYEDPKGARGSDSRVRFYPRTVEEFQYLSEDLVMWAEDPTALGGLKYFTDNM